MREKNCIFTKDKKYTPVLGRRGERWNRKSESACTENS